MSDRRIAQAVANARHRDEGRTCTHPRCIKPGCNDGHHRDWDGKPLDRRRRAPR